MTRNQKQLQRLTATQSHLIVFFTLIGLTAIALLGGFVTGDLRPLQMILSFVVGAFSGLMTGRFAR